MAAEAVTGDMSRRKKVKEKRPSPFLFSGRVARIFISTKAIFLQYLRYQILR
jgi:hypothetical protein